MSGVTRAALLAGTRRANAEKARTTATPMRYGATLAEPVTEDPSDV
jgi:hypothetical protein